MMYITCYLNTPVTTNQLEMFETKPLPSLAPRCLDLVRPVLGAPQHLRTDIEEGPWKNVRWGTTAPARWLINKKATFETTSAFNIIQPWFRNL